MINMITITRGGLKRDDGIVLDALEALASDQDNGFASTTHAAVTILRRDPQIRQAIEHLQSQEQDDTAEPCPVGTASAD